VNKGKVVNGKLVPIKIVVENLILQHRRPKKTKISYLIFIYMPIKFKSLDVDKLLKMSSLG